MSQLTSIQGLTRAARALLCFAAATLLAAGCGSDKKVTAPTGGGGPTSTSFTGILVNTTQTGRLTVTIATSSLAAPFRVARSVPFPASSAGAASVSATGMIEFPTDTMNLTGTYNTATDSLNLSGEGYTLEGHVDTSGSKPALQGKYSGPSGTGGFGCSEGTASTVQLYCGTFQSTTGSGTYGSLNVAVSGATLAGVAFPNLDDHGSPFSGTVTGTGDTRTINLEGTVPGDYSVSGGGTLNTVTREITDGTWAYEDLYSHATDSGTWSAVHCP